MFFEFTPGLPSMNAHSGRQRWIEMWVLDGAEISMMYMLADVRIFHRQQFKDNTFFCMQRIFLFRTIITNNTWHCEKNIENLVFFVVQTEKNVHNRQLTAR